MERNFTDGYTEWQSNPEIVAVNKLPQHATLMPYEDFEEAKKADKICLIKVQVIKRKMEVQTLQKLCIQTDGFCRPEL